MKRTINFLKKMPVFAASFLKGCFNVCWFVFIQALMLALAISSWSVAVEHLRYICFVADWGYISGWAEVAVHLLAGIFVLFLGITGVFVLLSELIFFLLFVKGIFEARYKRMYIHDRCIEFFEWVWK